jgi:excisionase family DNA binding protein
MQQRYLYSKSELAKSLSLSTRSIDSLVSSGRIPSVRVGTRRLFDPSEVTAALKAGVAAPENGGLGTGNLNR